jgi:hypothetical protein
MHTHTHRETKKSHYSKYSLCYRWLIGILSDHNRIMNFAFLSALSFFSSIHMMQINLMKLNHLKNMSLAFPRALF